MSTAPTNSIWQRLALVVGSGLILAFFSELYFLNEGPVEQAISALGEPLVLAQFLLELALWYSLFALWLLIPIVLFNVRSVWAFFLVACLCGWAIEGLVIPLLYAELPLSIVWPTMAWHAVVDVVLGWWLLRKLLLKNNVAISAVIALLLGLFWGGWATWLWEGDAPIISPTDFAIVAFIGTFTLMLGYLLVDRAGGQDFRPTKAELWFVAIISLLVWVVSTLAFTPLQLIFPILMLIVGLPLWLNKTTETRPTILATFSGHISLANLAMLLLMPLVASLTYFGLFERGIGFVEIWLVTLPLMLVGVGLFGLSIVKIVQRWRLEKRMA